MSYAVHVLEIFMDYASAAAAAPRARRRTSWWTGCGRRHEMLDEFEATHGDR